MAQQTFNDGDSGATVRTVLNDNANDAETRIAVLEGGTYGGMYANNEAGTLTLTTMLTYYKYVEFEGNTASNNMTPDHTNDEITIDADGDYLVSFDVAMQNTASREYEWAVHINDTVEPSLATRVGQGTLLRNTCGASGIVSLSNTDVIDLRVRDLTGNSSTAIGRDVQLNVVKVGD